MLSDQMRDYIKTKDKDSKWNRHVQAVYNHRIKKQVKEAIEDLALVAEESAEKELEKVFTVKEMRPFFKAFFKIEIKAKSHEEWLRLKNSKETKAKRKRLLELAKVVLEMLGDGTFVLTLLSEELRPYLNFNVTPENLKFVLYAQTKE